MGLAGAAADDADSEFILKICECEIVTGKISVNYGKNIGIKCLFLTSW